MENETTPQINNNILDTRTFEEKVKDMSASAMSIAPLLCAIGIAIWWLFYGSIEIYPTSLKITERIGLTICTVFLAVSYCKLISTGGFKSAKSTKEYKRLASDWGYAITKGNSQKKEIIEYAKSIARQNQKEVRTENLEKNGLRYCDFFNDDGELIYLEYKENKKNKHNLSGLTKSQIKIIKKCVNMRVDIPDMFGNISSKYFGLKKRISQKEFAKKNDISQTLIRLVISIFSVGFMFKFIGMSWGSFFYALFQIVMWSGSGILQRMKNYNFVVNELQPQILENTMIINGYLELEEDKKQLYKDLVIKNEQKQNRLLIEMKGA